MFQYCPGCGRQSITLEENKSSCPDCGFLYYHNTAAATGCVIQAGEKVVLLVRGREPAMGKLDLPGGFVDPGEGVLEGLLRELREELSWEPPIPYRPEDPAYGKSLAEVFKLFASFPNIYPYKNVVYNTCDIYFTVFAPELTEKDLKAEREEISAIRFVLPEEINPDELAFDSTRRAIEAFLKMKRL